MLRDEVKLFEELSGESADNVSIERIGSFLDGYNVGKESTVKRAHWIEEEDCTAYTDIPWSMCSACGSYSLKLPYCAFCGAKMDEE